MTEPAIDVVKRLRQRSSALRNERSKGWDAHHVQIRDLLCPRNARFYNEPENTLRGNAWAKIIDSAGTRAGNVLSAGLMAGMSSPARPWFRLQTADIDMMDHAPVKEWLNRVELVMRSIFARSNTYRSLHAMYRDLGYFGTAVSVIDDDFDNAIHLTPLTTGQYFIATDDKGRVCTLFRQFQMTVAQLVRKFGKENCSISVQQMYSRGDLDKYVDVTHSLQPREEFDPTKLDKKNMPYQSCYFETNNSESKFLSEGGMQRFRVLAPRWDVLGGDAYGTGPGSVALGHVKQLQQEQLRKAQGIDYLTDPPLQGPSAFKGRELDRFPGAYNPTDGGNNNRITSLYDVRLDLSHLLADIQDVRDSIDDAFYVKLFLMLANDDRSNITAREVVERHEEKLLMLGPVLERLHTEMHDPLIELTFDRMQRAVGAGGVALLPPPPPDLMRMPINVEFVSTLAQAQRAVGIQGVNQWLSILETMAPIKPSVMMKVNEMELAAGTADMLGVDAKFVKSDEDVQAEQAAAARQQQMAQAAAMAKPAADAAQAASTVGEMPQGQQQTLNDILANYTGYGSTAPGGV